MREGCGGSPLPFADRQAGCNRLWDREPQSQGLTGKKGFKKNPLSFLSTGVCGCVRELTQAGLACTSQRGVQMAPRTRRRAAEAPAPPPSGTRVSRPRAGGQPRKAARAPQRLAKRAKDQGAGRKGQPLPRVAQPKGRVVVAAAAQHRAAQLRKPTVQGQPLPTAARQGHGGRTAQPPPDGMGGQGRISKAHSAERPRRAQHQQGARQQQAPSPGFLQDISQALATLSRKIGTSGYPPSSDEDTPEPGPSSRQPRQHHRSKSPEGSTSPSPERQHAKSKKRKRLPSCRSRQCCNRGKESSSDSSGESSSSDDERGEGDYWQEAATVPGLPRWASRRRRATGELHRAFWGQENQDLGSKGPSFTDDEDPPGIHLTKKLRRAILNGFYVDIFKLVKPEGEEGNTGVRHRERKRNKTQGAEHTFDNWLEGFAEFVGVVVAAYPERGWHLNNHYRNVLKARKLAGDVAAMAYDEAFRKRASQSASTRWDLINYKHWLVEVGPNTKGRHENSRMPRGGRREVGRRVCWEYNAGKCARPRCKFDHDCDSCMGPHPRVACPRQRNMQQPFRASRPPSKPNIQREAQGVGPAAPTAVVPRK